MKFNVFIAAAIKIFSFGARWNFPFHHSYGGDGLETRFSITIK
jgi:hypothetical protein